MPVNIYINNDFSTTHEREFWTGFSKMITKSYGNGEEYVTVIGNVVIDGKELMDAVIFKKDAIIIIDFKDGGGDIIFKENDAWLRSDNSEIKGGSFTNPYLQIKYYRYKLKKFLNDYKNEYPDLDNANFDHINGIVLFRENISFENKTIPGNLRPWFHITDKNNIIEKIRSITTRTINFPDELIINISNLFGIENQNIRINEGVQNLNVQREIKNSEEERILDYYISCIEQEDIKNLQLKSELINGALQNHNSNYHLLKKDYSSFIENFLNDITITDQSVLTFINTENRKPKPRNLFIGYPLLGYQKNNNTYIYPKYYSQIIYQENSTDTFQRLIENELLLNKFFLKRCGLTDREEIESICEEINSISSYKEKELFLENLGFINSENYYELPFLYYSETSSITYNLLKELGERGLMNNYHVRQLKETPAKYLINKDIAPDIDLNYESESEVEIFNLNDSQENAIRTSLSKEFTVITGPPGTGKSQVVLNTLANAVMQNKTVLFASNNNKAVDVVKDRFIKSVFSENEQEMTDLILRLGNTAEMRNTFIQIERITNHLNDDRYVIEENALDNVLKKLKDINEEIKIKLNLIKETEYYLIVCRETSSYDYSIQTDFFSNKVFNLSIQEIDHKIHELKRLSDKLDLNILEKFILWLYPRYYFNKYFKILSEYKNNLPELIRKYIDREYLFENYNLNELKLHFEKLKEIKNCEEKIKTLKEFVFKNDIENIFKNDLKSAEKFLNNFKLKFTNEILQIKEKRVEVSRSAFKLKLKNSLRNLTPRIIQNYLDSMQSLFGNGRNITNFHSFMNEFEDNFKVLLESLPIWTVTSLSIRSRIPLLKRLFDLVIIDEASQCNIPSMIPLFYRAKNVCIIGDDLQLRHISGIKIDEDIRLANECGVPHVGGRYSEESLFDRSLNVCKKSNIKDVFLNEHYRSHEDIMRFCNVNFYIPKKSREMIHKTSESKLIFETQGIYWIDVTSNGETTKFKRNMYEVDRIIEVYNYYTSESKNENVSFGITTPFRNQGDAIREKLFDKKINGDKIIVLGDTVHKFQGDERDVIFFSPVISFEGTRGMKNFINYASPEILNVAVSRARSALIVVGDKAECSNAGGVLRRLADSAKIMEINNNGI